MALAGATFTAMLQLSLVCERWPLGRLGRLWSGIAALVLSWVIGVSAYFLFVNIGYLPVAERVAAGLRDPGGPVSRADFGAALIAVGVWQAVLFIALRGWALTLAFTAVAALVLYRVLATYAGGVRWIRAAPEDWITSASLSFAGAGVILHVGIGLRWPFAQPRRGTRSFS